MESLLSIVVGFMFAIGLYLILERSLVKLIFGLMLWSQAANLLIFTAAGLTKGNPAFVPIEGRASTSIADPLPQALILTAIVIGFGVISFTIVLSKKVYEQFNTDDLEQIREKSEL